MFISEVKKKTWQKDIYWRLGFHAKYGKIGGEYDQPAW